MADSEPGCLARLGGFALMLVALAIAFLNLPGLVAVVVVLGVTGFAVPGEMALVLSVAASFAFYTVIRMLSATRDDALGRYTVVCAAVAVGVLVVVVVADFLGVQADAIWRYFEVFGG